MLICIPEVLTKAAGRALPEASWTGRSGSTAGHRRRAVGLGQAQPAAARGFARGQGAGRDGADGLARSPLFISAAIPQRIFPPLFNSYGVGHSFGTHVDGAISAVPGTPIKIRTDLSVTLFLAEPEEYDGGELTVEDKYGTQEVKLPAGDWCSIPRPACTMSSP